jgi:hypothetical protein
MRTLDQDKYTSGEAGPSATANLQVEFLRKALTPLGVWLKISSVTVPPERTPKVLLQPGNSPLATNLQQLPRAALHA